MLDLGPQPPSNRFLREGEAAGDFHPLLFGACEACGLPQLADPMPPGMCRPRFDWISYNEPEGHLDALAASLAGGLGPGSRVLGVSYKDASLLSRISRASGARVRVLSAAEDWGAAEPFAQLESLQAEAGPERARGIASRFGRADLVVARHVLEHAHAPGRLLEALRVLAKPGGSVLIEVPDESRVLSAGDHCFLWEEHAAYFDEPCLRSLLAGHGFEVREFSRHPAAQEDSLAALARPEPGKRPAQVCGASFSAALRFADSFPSAREGVSRAVGGLGRAAVFGAGHLAAKFVNFHGLSGSLAGVIDDHPRKQGLRMPGSGLRILPSSVLEDGSLDACLLALGPESARRVREKHGNFKGRFLSIFRSDPEALSI
jgi:SAM-dependent methyltransferase